MAFLALAEHGHAFDRGLCSRAPHPAPPASLPPLIPHLCSAPQVDYQRFADQLMKYAHGRPSKEQEKEREQKYAAVKACLVSRKLYPFPHPPK